MHDLIEPNLPGGIVGNGRMLCSIRTDGMLHRLFWPDIDWGQHMGILKIGLQLEQSPTTWLDNSGFTHNQFYLEKSNIFTTEMNNSFEKISLFQTDMVHTEKDILIRSYKLVNNGIMPREINLIAYCSFSINESNTQDCIYYSSTKQAIVHYRRNVFLGFKLQGKKPYGYQCGRRNTHSDPLKGADKGEFWGNKSSIKYGAGSMGWHLGTVEQDNSIEFSLILAAASNDSYLFKLLDLPILSDTNALTQRISQYWNSWLDSKPKQKFIADNYYDRSLLAIKLMTNKESGAMVAAPEFDSHYLACGGYGYCWPRDAMFVALALDEAGYHQEAENFYLFAGRIQNSDGSWHQRYHMNGSLAPTWGQQIDQMGAVLWGYYHHYRLTGNVEFLKEIWPSVYKGAQYLALHRSKNGLPIPTMDIWEDQFAQSTYASSAVYGGLKGSARLAYHLGKEELQKQWDKTADSVKDSIIMNQWNKDFNSFIRSVNHNPNEGHYIQDTRLDIALLGLVYPYSVLPPAHSRIQSTAKLIKERLSNSIAGGIHRYEGDSYAGGNPWVLGTLWLSIFHSLQGEKTEALKLIKWAEKNSSQAELLPEQVHRLNGGPEWVLPLSWSHAMYILACLAYQDRLYPIGYST